jgi:DNA-binding LacI/PurR family transcriptional regulator
MKPRPTGWLLANAAHYLTVVSYLGSLGLKVPDDVSLISRDEEPFLRHLHPLPTHYTTSPVRFAKQLNRALQRLESGSMDAFSLRIIPDLAVGRSVAPPKSGI